MAQSRVINFARSPNAQVYVYFKFSVEVNYQKVEIFHSALRSFVRDRPREWSSFGAFRPTKIMADLGYIEYITFLIHVSLTCVACQLIPIPSPSTAVSTHAARSMAESHYRVDEQSRNRFVWQ